VTNVLLRILGFVVGIPLSAWLLVLPIIFIWWFLDTYTRDEFTQRHEKIAATVVIGTFFSLVLVLGQGIEALLVFIPADWGGHGEDGEFVSARDSWAVPLAILVSFFFVHAFSKFDTMRNENKHLSNLAEIQNRRAGLRHLHRETLIEKQGRTEADLQKLGDRLYEGRLSSGGERELRVLEELLDELNYWIRATEPSDVLDEE